jgi:hypothetical protein
MKLPRQLAKLHDRNAAAYAAMDERANGPYRGSAAERSHRGKPPAKDPWRNKTGRGRGKRG